MIAIATCTRISRCIHHHATRSTLSSRSKLSVLPVATGFPKRSFSNNTNGFQLHYDWVTKNNDYDDGDALEHVVLFLHGLLGNGRNLRTMAKKLCEAHQQPGILLDVRGHGNSKLPVSSSGSGVGAGAGAVSSFETCVQDVHQTLQSIPQVTTDTAITLVGHSLGGRISLQYAHDHVTTGSAASNYPLERVWLLDTVPGEANDSVERVVSAVTELSSQAPITDKKKLVQQLTDGSTYNIDMGTAQWLASSLQKSSNNDGTLQFSFDLAVVNDLLANFHRQDFMKLLQEILEANNTQSSASTSVKVDLVRGGKNKGWRDSTIGPLEALQQEYSSTFGMHELPQAGHWVHVDDLPGLLAVMDVSY